MTDNTKIEWTDATVNVINGCSVTSPGCKFCYAMKQAHRFDVRRGLTTPTSGGMVWTGEVRFNENALVQPLQWKRPRKIFWNAHGDMFHENVPDEWIDRCFAVMALTPHHQHQVLTKRSARMRAYLAKRIGESTRPCNGQKLSNGGRVWNQAFNIGGADRFQQAIKAFGMDGEELPWPLPNVWLGVSVEDQARADERIPDLLATPAAVRFLSCEPLLGPVDLGEVCGGSYFQNPLTGHRWHDAPDGVASATDMNGTRIDWVIVGGESGPGARSMHPDWARSIRNQCAAAGVAFHFKQWGEWTPVTDAELPEGWGRECDRFRIVCSNGFVGPLSLEAALLHKPAHSPQCFPEGAAGDCSCRVEIVEIVEKVGKRAAGRLLDGVTHDGMPA